MRGLAERAALAWEVGITCRDHLRLFFIMNGAALVVYYWYICIECARHCWPRGTRLADVRSERSLRGR